MRILRPSGILLLAALLLALVLASSAAAAPRPHTYKALVGAGQVARGAEVMAFFPSHLKVHVGDRVRWVQNTNEIHNVTFLGSTTTVPALIVTAASLGLPDTPSTLVLNPQVVNKTSATRLGDTSTYLTSGIMGRETGQYRTYTLRFTAKGTYPYLCAVHGTMMSGAVTVVGKATRVASPKQVMAQARRQIDRQLAKVPAVVREAKATIKPATSNPDGSMTHYVELGYEKGQIDLMRFFPGTTDVAPGDTVMWELGATDTAPHTVTFLNGAAEPGLAIAVEQPSGPPVLYIDPATLLPSLPTAELTRTGLYNSGLMQPGAVTSFTLKVDAGVTAGPLPFICLLHDTSGMKGTLNVVTTR